MSHGCAHCRDLHVQIRRAIARAESRYRRGLAVDMSEVEKCRQDINTCRLFSPRHA